MIISWFGILVVIGATVALVAGLSGRRCNTASNNGGSGLALGVMGLLAIGALVAFAGYTRLEATRSSEELVLNVSDTALAVSEEQVPLGRLAGGAKSLPSEDEQQLRTVVGLLSSAIEKVEDSDVELGSFRGPLKTFKDACDKIASEEGNARSESETQVLNTSTVVDGTPAWITEAQPGNTRLVESGPHASREAAERAAYAMASSVIMTDYRSHMTGVSSRFKPDLSVLDGNPIERRHTIEIPWDFAAGSGIEANVELPKTAYKTYLRVRTDKDTRGMIYRQWKRRTQGHRLQTVATLFGAVIAGAFVLAMFFGSDNRMQGRWRKTRFLAAAAAIGVVVAFVGESRDADIEDLLNGANHTGPAAHAAESSYGTASSDGHPLTRSTAVDRSNLPTSTFFGLPIQGSRVSVVVLGDKDVSEDDRARLRDGLLEYAEGFDLERAAMNVVCSDSRSPRTLRIRNPNSRHGANNLQGIENLLDGSFEGSSKRRVTEAALRAALTNRPDTIVVVRGTEAALDADDRGALERLRRQRPDVVFHGIDLSDSSDCEALRDFVSLTHGNFVRVEIE